MANERIWTVAETFDDFAPADALRKSINAKKGWQAKVHQKGNGRFAVKQRQVQKAEA